MSPREVWCNEAQERYVLAIPPDRLEAFRALCERERCPFAVVGTVTDDHHLVVHDALFGNDAVDMDLPALLGKPPRMTRDVTRVDAGAPRLRHRRDHHRRRRRARPARACRRRQDVSHLDRRPDRRRASAPATSASGRGRCRWRTAPPRCCRSMGYAGEAFAIGERTPLAVVDAPASGRMAVAEALMNLAAAPVRALSRVKLSANWMAAAGAPGEDAALFDTVRAVALDLCPALGVSIPVGKDSMSMRTPGRSAARGQRSSARSRSSSRPSRRATTCAARGPRNCEPTRARRPSCSSTSRTAARGSAGPFSRRCTTRPATKRLMSTTRRPSARCSTRWRPCAHAGRVLAYHDRSDGGLFVTLCEMAFAGHVGRGDRRRRARSGRPRRWWPRSSRRSLAPSSRCATPRSHAVLDILRARGLGARVVARVAPDDRVRVRAANDAAVQRVANRAPAGVERDHLADPVAARQPRVRPAGVRPHPRRRRPRDSRRSSRSIRPTMSRRRSSRTGAGPRSRSCATRA